MKGTLATPQNVIRRATKTDRSNAVDQEVGNISSYFKKL